MSNRSLVERLDAEHAQAWKPEPGDTLIGEVVELSERDGGYGSYPIVTIRTDDGEELAFHAFHTVAASQLAGQRPQVGEQIGVKYKGKAKGSGDRADYHDYTVMVDRPGGGSINWSRYGDGEEQSEPAPAGTADLKGVPAGSGDDDIPF